MLTNEKIEMQLKQYNLWYQTNNYFIARINDFKYNVDAVTKNGHVNNRFLVNATENDILFIPINSSNLDEILKDEIVYVCVGDIEKITVTNKNHLYTNLKVEQKDGTIYNIEVDLGYDLLQKENIKKFVSFFRNEGSYLLNKSTIRIPFSREINSNNMLDNKLNTYSTILILAIFMSLFSMIFIVMIDIDLAEITFGIMRKLITVFFVLLVFLNIVKKYNITFKNISNQKKNTKEKPYNDIVDKNIDIVNDNPISSDDESYGGIKRL